MSIYISKDGSVSETYSDEIKAGEIVEVSLITDSKIDTVFLRLIKPKTKEVAPVLATSQNSSSNSGSRHREVGEVLGMATTTELASVVSPVITTPKIQKEKMIAKTTPETEKILVISFLVIRKLN